MIKFTDIERMKGPLNVKKHELVYGDGFPYKQGRGYFIIYMKSKEEFFITPKGKQLYFKKPKSSSTMYGAYKNAKGSLSRELYLKPYILDLTKKQKENGTVTRAFARQTNSKDGCIFEVNPKSIEQRLLFYQTVSIEWKLNGSKDAILLANTKALKVADRTLKGISDFLDPLELYEEELTPEQLVKIKLGILAHNPYHYKTSEEASNVAKNLGISGARKSSDGSWMPGSSRDDYNRVVTRKNISMKPTSY